jgi:hypothetical protein
MSCGLLLVYRLLGWFYILYRLCFAERILFVLLFRMVVRSVLLSPGLCTTLLFLACCFLPSGFVDLPHVVTFCKSVCWVSIIVPF